jgi:hypothetical protein
MLKVRIRVVFFSSFLPPSFVLFFTGFAAFAMILVPRFRS